MRRKIGLTLNKAHIPSNINFYGEDIVIAGPFETDYENVYWYVGLLIFTTVAGNLVASVKPVLFKINDDGRVDHFVPENSFTVTSDPETNNIILEVEVEEVFLQ